MKASGTESAWVMVSTGFRKNGGMESANAALARYLLNRGTEVHLVAHDADEVYATHPSAHKYLIRRPANSFMLGEPFLGRRGASVAARLTSREYGVRVLVNGGCCAWPDINWVHCVHAAWQTNDEGAPTWFKAKNRAMKLLARRREGYALRQAKFVVANSRKTKHELTTLLGIPEARVRTIYLGTNPEFKPYTAEERLSARSWLGKSFQRPIIAFVGALGHDNNKGFDTLWKAWKRLCATATWDADLIVAGGGRALGLWRERIKAHQLSARTTLLGFTDKVRDVLGASDLLVSPVRYEAFGLNVQEALAQGIPAIVSARAGVAELYPTYLRNLLLNDPEDVDELVGRLLSWRSNLSFWKETVQALSRDLRGYTWDNMARRMVEFVNEVPARLDDRRFDPRELYSNMEGRERSQLSQSAANFTCEAAEFAK